MENKKLPTIIPESSKHVIFKSRVEHPSSQLSFCSAHFVENLHHLQFPYFDAFSHSPILDIMKQAKLNK